FKSQFKRADRSGAAWALILGEDELANGRLGIKPLRGDAEQETLSVDAAAARLRELLKN
ncbi:MAG: His/Gly/Thr/Pro-type tRNA ligase C-terminal domain-containing protein, partial [Gammaproteobacteria bacterium]